MSVVSSTSTTRWSIVERIAFRFVFIYFLLYIIIQNNGAFPFWRILMGKPTEWLQQFIPWVGKLVFNVDITVFTNGSGDTTYDYVISFVILVVAIIGTTVWSAIDRNRNSYVKMYYWLSVAVRFYVGLMLINYGLVKVIKLQFPYPAFYRLIEPYGDSSPMGLAWTFLGFSKGYNLFMGIAEVLAGLLFFRRTLTLGAIITLMATANVMAVNYFYDVPVKLLSTHLVIFTLFLLSRDIKKLLTFFLTSKAVSLTPIPKPKFKKDWIPKLMLGFKVLLLGYIFIYGPISVIQGQYMYGEKAPKPALYGMYEVFNVVKNNKDTIPANINDFDRWRYIIMERKGFTQIHTMTKARLSFRTEVDTTKKEILFTNYSDTTEQFTMRYHKKDSIFKFETYFRGDTLQIKAKHLTKDDFLLTNRGFNWINEYPFNR